MTDLRCKRIWMGIAAFAVVARVLIVFLYPYVSGDYVYFLRHWAEHLVKNGFEQGWHNGTWNYTMPYIYLLTLMTRITTHWLIGVKIISIIFDVVLACSAWRVVRAAVPRGGLWRPWMAAAVILLLPTFFSNSTLWGQCDAIYTSFALFGVDALMRRRPAWAMVFFGIAFAIKLQTVFVIPALLMLTFNRRIPWWTWSLVPLVCIVLALPAMAMGRGIIESYYIYIDQAVTNNRITYAWVPSIWQFVNKGAFGPLVIKSMIATCGIATLVLAYVWAKKIDNKMLEGWGIPVIVFISVAVVPFLLSGMHERYFALPIAMGAVMFTANPRRMWPCLIPEVLSWPSYMFYLVGEDNLGILADTQLGFRVVSLLYFIFLVWLFISYFGKNSKMLTNRM